jgi:hypothetical protein
VVASAAAAVVASAALASTIGPANPATASVAAAQIARVQQSDSDPAPSVTVFDFALEKPTTAPVAATSVPAKPKAPAVKHAAPKPVVRHKSSVTAAVKSAPDPYAGESAYKVAEAMVPASQFAAFAWIIEHESGWNVEAQNPSSGAYGLGQALPASKMAPYGPDYLTDPATQIKWALAYMDGRYGSPNAAKAFWEAHGWY